MASRVCVVGAGIAGLVTAKVLHQDGFDVVVFEKAAALGGVWEQSRTYPGLRANNPRETYAFSDHAYPPTADDFPTAAQVRDYLESYATRFGLHSLIRFETEVIEVRDAPPQTGAAQTFTVTFRPGKGSPEILPFDFVVVCNGVYSEPHVPELKNRDSFSGEVAHSSEIGRIGIDGDMRVVVIGAGKSALDCATSAAQRGAPTTLLFRDPHWMVPRFFFGRIRIDYLLMNRFSELFFAYHRPSRVEAFLHGPARALVRLWWRQNNALIRRLMGMPEVFRPDTPLPSGFENIGVGEDFYRVLREGKLVAKRTGVKQFTEGGVELDSGERVDADLVIFATGWRQGIPFLSPRLRDLVQRDGRFKLYRFILPPRVPRLGFVGYASSTACQFTSEIAAHWLSESFRGRLKLPSASEMEEEVERVQHWLSRVVPRRDQGYFIGPYICHYADDLLRDLGLPTRRSKNIIAEYMAPFRPSRYATLGRERTEARARTPEGPDKQAPMQPSSPIYG